MIVVQLLAAVAAHTATACLAIDGKLPSYLSAWKAPAIATATIEPGKAATVSTATPLALAVTRAGIDGIAINGPAWIDVIRDGVVIESIEHGHGPECSSIRKIVGFNLKPGRYEIRLTKAQSATMKLMVVELP